MRTRYTRKQICEAISYWEKKLYEAESPARTVSNKKVLFVPLTLCRGGLMPVAVDDNDIPAKMDSSMRWNFTNPDLAKAIEEYSREAGEAFGSWDESEIYMWLVDHGWQVAFTGFNGEGLTGGRVDWSKSEQFIDNALDKGARFAKEFSNLNPGLEDRVAARRSRWEARKAGRSNLNERRYSRAQICEAISYWRKQLRRFG